MAAIVDFQRVTHQEVVVKISGVGEESATIDLDEDLFAHGQIGYGAGTISVTDDSTTVTGTGTAFAANAIGARLYREDTKAFLGEIASVTNATTATLVDNAVSDLEDGSFGIAYRSDELKGDVQTVPIVSVMYAGTGVATVTRDSVVTLTLNAAGANGKLDIGTYMGPDKQQETKDIVVDFSGDDSVTQVWLKLRKVGGWATRIETAYYGAHDDETRVGPQAGKAFEVA